MISQTFLCVLALAVGSVRGEQPPTPAGRLTPYRDRQLERGRIHDVELDGYRYCLLDTGGTDGPPLVLLHGLGGSLYDWRHVVDALAASRRVIALDLLGAGESSMPSTADYSVFAQARRVKGLLDALGIDRATLVGNSYGGGVALAFAQDWPEPSRTKPFDPSRVDTPNSAGNGARRPAMRYASTWTAPTTKSSIPSPVKSPAPETHQPTARVAPSDESIVAIETRKRQRDRESLARAKHHVDGSLGSSERADREVGDPVRIDVADAGIDVSTVRAAAGTVEFESVRAVETRERDRRQNPPPKCLPWT